MNFEQTEATAINEDNQGTIALSKNPKYHSRTKHIDMRHHFLRDKVEKSEIVLSYCPAEETVADVMTKQSAKIRFQKLRELMGLFNDICRHSITIFLITISKFCSSLCFSSGSIRIMDL